MCRESVKCAARSNPLPFNFGFLVYPERGALLRKLAGKPGGATLHATAVAQASCLQVRAAFPVAP